MRASDTRARDPIAFVEACYDLGATEERWLKSLAELACPLMHAETVLAYHIDLRGDGISIENPVQSGDAHGEVTSRIAAFGELFERRRVERLGFVDQMRATVFEKVARAHLAESADRMLLSEKQTFGPRWAYTLGVPGIRDLFFMVNQHIDRNGATFLVGALADRAPLPPARRVMFQRLSAHLKAGLRLRRRLPEHLRSFDAPEDGAVLDGSARVVHAEGDARSVDARALLEHKAREIDAARARRGGRDEEALAVWQGLLDGRWSLVERFDADGRRFLLAHKNPEEVVDPRGLAPLEARVAGLAARGYADKLIAYHLGIAEGTVSSHLARAMRKLGLASRVELVRVLGRGHPSRREEPGA